MPGVLRGLLGFVRELDRGLATMRGKVEPGAYDRRRGRRCGQGARSIRRHASVRRKNGRSKDE